MKGFVKSICGALLVLISAFGGASATTYKISVDGVSLTGFSNYYDYVVEYASETSSVVVDSYIIPRTQIYAPPDWLAKYQPSITSGTAKFYSLGDGFPRSSTGRFSSCTGFLYFLCSFPNGRHSVSDTGLTANVNSNFVAAMNYDLFIGAFGGGTAYYATDNYEDIRLGKYLYTGPGSNYPVYTYTIAESSVSAIPVPASLAFALSGLAAFCAIGRLKTGFGSGKGLGRI